MNIRSTLATAGRVLGQLRHDFALVELEEALLVAPDLVDADVVVARLHVATDRAQVPLGIVAADDLLCDGVLRDQLCGRLEV